MVLICAASLILGALLGGRFKILSVVPASLSLSALVLTLSYGSHGSLLYGFTAVFLAITLVPLGYLVRAAIHLPEEAAKPKPVVLRH